jgi:hypothetical protein
MEFITSRKKLTTDSDEMEKEYRFHMWATKRFPYSNLLPGDILYWFDSTEQKIVWKTNVTVVNREHYFDKQIIFNRYPNSVSSDFKESRSDDGFFIGYKVKVIEKLNIDKPFGFRFPNDGWRRIDDDVALLWFGKTQIDEIGNLDNYLIDEKINIAGILNEINVQMQDVSSERVEKLILMTLRKDSKIINVLKLAAGYKCQFPGCGQQILKKNGGVYIEVAHIKPVAKGGKSILGNLLVLCPNHHKEFDFGDLKIHEQYPSKIIGQLNGKSFNIDMAKYQ